MKPVCDVTANDVNVPGVLSGTRMSGQWTVTPVPSNSRTLTPNNMGCIWAACWGRYPACDSPCTSWRDPPKLPAAGRPPATVWFSCTEITVHTVCCSENAVRFALADDGGVHAGTPCWAAEKSLLICKLPRRRTWGQGKQRQDLTQHHIRTQLDTTAWVHACST